MYKNLTIQQDEKIKTLYINYLHEYILIKKG